MTRFLPLLLVIPLLALSCPIAFAQRQLTMGDAVLNDTGSLNGVDMQSAGTLQVGTVGGAQRDIFSQNAANFSLLAVSTFGMSANNIVFNSSSNVRGAIGTSTNFFLNLTGGGNGTVVNFLGPVFATQTRVGTGSLNFNSGSFNRTAMFFTGDGTFTLSPNTQVTGALTTEAGRNTGTVVLANGSILDGAIGAASPPIRSVTVTGGSNDAGAVARVSGEVNAVSFSLGTNTLLVGGALTIAGPANDGVINTTLASPTVFGNIRPVGTTNLGPQLALNVLVPSTSFIPVGTVFNIVQSQLPPQTGTSGSVVNVNVQNPTNPLYRFSAVPPAGTLNGLVAIRTDAIPLQVPLAPPPGAVLPPVAPIAAVVAQILLTANPTGDLLLNVLPAINALSDPTAVVNALAQLAPRSPELTAPLLSFQGNRQLQNLWLSHMDDLTSAGGTDRTTTTSDAMAGTWSRRGDPRVWVKGSGYFGDQDARGAFAGYDSRILATAVGYDRNVGRRTRAGVGFGYANSEIDGNGIDTGSKIDFDTYQGTAYAVHERGRVFAYGDLAYGTSDYSGRRPISFPGIQRVAQSRYRGHDFTAFGAAGYRFRTDQGTMITPLASLQYTPLRIDGYTETGAGDLNLRVQSENHDYLESGLGVKVSRLVRRRKNSYLPEAHARWLHLLDNPALRKTAAFTFAGSSSFTTPGMTPSDDTYNVGAGITLLASTDRGRAWSLQGTYDHDWRSDGFSADQGLVKLALRF